MRIGTPKEIKNREFRVALTPHGVYVVRCFETVGVRI